MNYNYKSPDNAAALIIATAKKLDLLDKLQNEQRGASLTFSGWCLLNEPAMESVERIKQEWGLADDDALGWYGQDIVEGLVRGLKLDDIDRTIYEDQALRDYGKCFMPAYPVTQFEKAFEQRFLNETDIGRSIVAFSNQLH
jgi:hypothetical protein